MDDGYSLRSWIVENWPRMALPFAVLMLCSLPIFLTANNVALILLYTLLPVYMIHQYEEHAHGRFVEFFNSTIGRGQIVLVNGLTHVIASLALRRYNPGLYTTLLLFFPWGVFLLVYFNAASGSNLVFNVIGLLVGIVGHAIIVVYALRRRSRLESGPQRGAEASP
jgi:hypothetical protein